KYVQSLEFTDLAEAAERESRRLRAEGAHLVIALAHAGLECGLSHPLPPRRELRWTPKDRQPGCEKGGEVVELARRLPRGAVDAIVAGHTHQVIHHWVEGIPVIQSGAHGRYFTILELSYDLEAKRPAADRARI